MTDKKTKPLLVTTEHKGVFFGYGQVTDDKIIKLTEVEPKVRSSAVLCRLVRTTGRFAEGGPERQ